MSAQQPERPAGGEVTPGSGSEPVDPYSDEPRRTQLPPPPPPSAPFVAPGQQGPTYGPAGPGAGARREAGRAGPGAGAGPADGAGPAAGAGPADGQVAPEAGQAGPTDGQVGPTYGQPGYQPAGPLVYPGYGQPGYAPVRPQVYPGYGQPGYPPAGPRTDPGSGYQDHPPAGFGLYPTYGYRPYAIAPKSAGLAVLASLFVPGLGSMLNGETSKGIGILVGFLISFVLTIVLIGFAGMVAFWIWGMVDASNGAQRWNARHGIVS